MIYNRAYILSNTFLREPASTGSLDDVDSCLAEAGGCDIVSNMCVLHKPLRQNPTWIIN